MESEAIFYFDIPFKSQAVITKFMPQTVIPHLTIYIFMDKNFTDERNSSHSLSPNSTKMIYAKM